MACGKLLKALDVQALNDYTMELFTSEQPYALQVNFTSELEDRDSLDAAMNQKSMVLLALIDNLDDVRWTTPSGK
ncbi:MAG: DUF4825 domain-containing protein, partial [Oscillibacter sp.]|nr:DUF4825 domain-containing protein [Oscillibacter sp.]